MTNHKDIEAAVELGADAIGFNLYNQSSRYVGPDILPELIASVPPFVQRVAVVVNFSITDIQRLNQQMRIDIWQLHGDELPEFCHWMNPLRAIKAFGLPFEEKEPDPNDYEVDAFLLDRSAPQYGGTGQTFDWSLANTFKQKTSKPIILSGGLKIENVAHAIQTVRPYAVDVCSGVESIPGKKDYAKMKDFIQAACQA